MRIARRVLIGAVSLLRLLRLLILYRRWCVRRWWNKHRRVWCVQRWVFDATRGRLGIDVLARVVVWIRTWSPPGRDRKSTRLNSSHSQISYAVFCLKKKKNKNEL